MSKRRYVQPTVPISARLSPMLAQRFYDECAAAGVKVQEGLAQAIESWLNMRELDREFSRAKEQMGQSPEVQDPEEENEKGK